MGIAFALVALAVTVLVVSGLSRKLDLPAPLVLIVIGVAIAFIPGVPTIHLESEVVLLGLLPPLLYTAALQTSLVDFNANRGVILLLSVGLVVFTMLGVGVLVYAVIPDLGWPLAFALGAVVAPPDAVAATAVARRIGLPRRIVTILEGESLFNDATALVSLRTAIAAAGIGVAATGNGEDGGISVAAVGLDFAIAAGGGAAIGLVTFMIVAQVRRRLIEPVLDVGISLVVPFAAYLAAERVHASGVIAVVIAGLLLGHKAPIIQTAASRIAERTSWRTIAFLLENAVFLLIGLQARWLLGDVQESELSPLTIVLLCVGTLVAVIILRLAWVFASRAILLSRRVADGVRPRASYAFILGWAGMRGVVTLAAAFLIPEEAPHREVLLLIAFSVVAGTLLIQGASLPWWAKRLRVPPPDPADDALARATILQQASNAGTKVLDAETAEDPHGIRTLIEQRLDQRNFAAWERLATTEGEPPSEAYSRIRLAMIAAERERVLEIRSSGSVPSEVITDVLAMLDVEESMLDVASDEREHLSRTDSLRRDGEECAHLQECPPRATTLEPICVPCAEEGATWVALRECLECGNVGCCDSSVGKHATGHFRETGHPVMESAESGESWRWCYVHHLTS